MKEKEGKKSREGREMEMEDTGDGSVEQEDPRVESTSSGYFPQNIGNC
jgi:hypothetical protein